MLDHHLQRSIVYQLAFVNNARFSELKPEDIDNKLFTYHLKKVVNAGYVTKSPEGVYKLTAEGRRLSTGARDKEKDLIVERAHSVLFLIIRRSSDGAYLFYKRNTHPMLGFSGFMHCNPTPTENTTEAARTQCQEKTGLDGDFTPLGGGYFRIYIDNKLESFTHFTLLVCNDVVGKLQPHDNRADYFWETKPNFTSSELFPGTQILHDAYKTGKPFFIEQTFYL
jgi:hypothetical protein